MRKDLLTIAMMLAIAPSVSFAAPRAIPDGMCEVIMEAHDVFGNGNTGFQLLIDADHSLVAPEGNIRPGGFYFGDYSAFEYKIPENADAAGGTSNCVVDDEVSVFVPAGVYDWMVIVPMLEGLSITNGDFAVGDDFELVAGKTYRFVAGMRQGQYAEEDWVNLVVDTDYGVSAPVMPATGMGMTNAETVGVTVSNLASTAVDNVSVWYKINDGEPVRETLSGSIEPGKSVEYLFNTRADFSEPIIYNVTFGVDAPGDLIGTNNTVSGTFRHLKPLDLPFTYDFAPNQANFNMDWIVIDANNDDSTWEINAWVENPDGMMGVASCGGCWQGDRTGNDWLISQPLKFNAGAAHVLLNINCVSADNKETLELCYSPTTNPADMVPIAKFDCTSQAWVKKAANFTIPTEGSYYIGLHAVSVGGLNIRVADITVNEGEFIGTPAPAVLSVVAPYSNCDLPSDYVGLVIENRGTADLKDYTISCTVTGPGEKTQTVSQTFGDAIAPDGSSRCLIAQNVDFTEVGKYNLAFTLTAGEVSLTHEHSLECFEPYTAVPVTTNFANNFNTEFWTKMDPAGWYYEAMFNDFASTRHGADAGLLSRGMTLSHDARVKMSYFGGDWNTAGITVYAGKAGVHPFEYDIVYEDLEVSRDGKEVEFTVPVSEPGNYSIMIADTGDAESSSFIHLNEVAISEVFPYDIRIENVDGPFARCMPAKFTGIPGDYTATVTNRGTEPMTGVKLEVSSDGNKIGESAEAVTIPAGETVEVPFTATLPKYNVDNSFRFSITATGDKEDSYIADNTYLSPIITVTAETLSSEDLEEIVSGTGAYGEPLYIGNVYKLATQSALTSVDLGFAPSEMEDIAGMTVGVNIYIVKDGKIERRIYSKEFTRGKGGFVNIDMQDMLLPRGTYYFEAAQLGTNNFGLGYDSTTPATCWQRVEDELIPVPGYPLAVRANFADGAKIYARDAQASGFAAPTTLNALFGNDETVVVTVRNAGAEDADIDIELLLDGVKVASDRKSLLFLEDMDVEFPGIDLSKAGVHTLECRVATEADDNADNDKAVLTITSAEVLDPFSMDFEGCNDFDAHGDRLNPAWTTEDRNGVRTDNYWRYQYRYKSEPCGFMAFNPHATVPSMDETPLEGFYPYAGNRFGAAFCYTPFAEGAEGLEHSDVWMVSPVLELGDNSSFELYVKTRCLETMENQLEPFQLLVSEESEGYDSFVVLGEETRLAPVEDWGLATADLSAYDRKKVRVAVRYIGVPIKNVCMMIDNLKVKTTPSGVQGIENEVTGLRYAADLQQIVVDGAAADLSVFAADGACVARAAGAKTLDVSSLPAGVYIARTASKVLKFIK